MDEARVNADIFWPIRILDSFVFDTSRTPSTCLNLELMESKHNNKTPFNWSINNWLNQ